MFSADQAPDALLALGRLDGALDMASPPTLRLFALRLLRMMLITALRQEGHSFTDHRFHIWFAGVATLSDEPARTARPPRALCEAILTELTHSSWDLLAQAAARLQIALLAPSDHAGSSYRAQTAHQEAGAVIAGAATLIAGLAPSHHPLAALAQLHHAAGAHVVFAPPERAAVPFALGPNGMRLTAEPTALPSPRWALELLWGRYWRKTGHLTHALPFPGLIRLDLLQADLRASGHGDFAWDPDDRNATTTALATVLRDVACSLNAWLSEADRLSRHLEESHPGKRRSSRAPALLELLAGFGPMRAAQLEALAGVTRLGLRTMLEAIDTAGLLGRTTLAGVHIYSVNFDTRVKHDGVDCAALPTFTPAALDEYDAALADIDALLARSGVHVEDDGDACVP